MLTQVEAPKAPNTKSAKCHTKGCSALKRALNAASLLEDRPAEDMHWQEI